MTLLAIESATDLVGVALVRPDGGEAEREHVGGRAHAELLAPFIEEVCAVSGCALSGIDAIAVDIGPGLFTGLRVGVATAKALGQALSVGIVAVSSLDILAAAAAARLEGAPGTVMSVVDARRGELFAAVYRFEPGDARPDPRWVRDDRAEPLAPEALAGWLGQLGDTSGPVTVVGNGAVRYHSLFASVPQVDLELAEELSSPSPLALARLARQRLDEGEVLSSAGEVVPDYRRPADARINWEQRAPRR